MNNVIFREHETYKQGKTFYCRVLDIDYDKHIIDLIEEDILEEKFLKKSVRKDYNKQKIVKYQLWKNQSDILAGTILLIKDFYLVIKLTKYPKVIAHVYCK